MLGDREKIEEDLEKNSFLRNSFELIAGEYGISSSSLLQNLFIPMKRYYLRVNMLKAEVAEAVEVLKKEGIEAKRSGLIEEAVFLEVQEGEKIEAGEKIAVAEREAAERVMLGSNLYMPGLKRVLNARKGDEVTVVSEEGIPVAKGILEIEPREVNRKAKGTAVRVLKSLYRLPKVRELEAYKKGIITDQSYPSMLIGRSLYSPVSGLVYVDMTASPGGKIGHIYEITRGRGKYFSFDHTEKKVERLKREMERIGASDVFVSKEDSRFLSLKYPSLKAEITILDPPCSGLGNRPRLSLNPPSDREMMNLISLQRQLLKEAARITAPGGYISYSTCTITYEENEAQAEWALKNLPLEVSYPPFPFPQSKLADFPAARFIPGIHDTIGFFFSLFRRI